MNETTTHKIEIKALDSIENEKQQVLEVSTVNLGCTSEHDNFFKLEL